MKNIFLTACLIGACTIASAADPIDYPVAEIDVDSDKFQRIYDQVLAAKIAKDQANQVRARVLQNIEANFYLVEIGDTTYATQIKGKLLADDTVVALNLVESDEVYQFTTVTGATRTVKIAVPPAQEELTKALFIEQLKAGTKFIITKPEYKRCSSCNGFGGSSSLSRGGAKTCGSCGGSGKRSFDREIIIRW